MFTINSKLTPTANKLPSKILPLVSMAISLTVNAETTKQLEDMLVSAHLTPTSKAQIGSAITVISAEQIARMQKAYVSDLLRTVPGLAVNQSGGGFGSFTQVRIRGAEANQTLVIIDGIEVNDPSNGSEYNFGNLLTENIERIEVIRGAQSALYGSDSIGGVINIITKKGSQGLDVNASVEAGSFDTYIVSGGLSGGWQQWLDFVFNVSQFESEGISAAAAGTERDANRNLTLDGNFRVRPLEQVEIGFNGRLVRSSIETDGFQGGIGAIDANNETEERQKYGRVYAKVDLFADQAKLDWQHILSAGYSENKRDNFSDQLLGSEFNGRHSQYQYQTNLLVNTEEFLQSQHTLTFLLEHERDMVNANSAFTNVNRDIETTGYVGEYRLSLLERISLSGSVRYDDNDNFDHATTYRATLSYVHPETDTRIHSSYGTGVKNPTLFELFGFSDTFVGNPDLEPEESQSWDIGVEQQLFDGRLLLDVSYYNNRIENLIIGSGITAINQAGRTHINGIETGFTAELTKDLGFQGSYTWISTADSNGVSLIRRPRHLASANLNYAFDLGGNPANLNLGVQYNGKQTDFAFDESFNRSIVELKDFTLLNLTGRYQIYSGVELFARVENLLDESYQEVFSFASKGVAGYGGVNIRFDPYFAK